jgi:GT2 family glycosyltransferase
MKPASPRVAVSLLHWGDPADTAAAIASLGHQTIHHLKIFVVDQTGSLDIKLPASAELIKPGANLGYAGGNNLALKRIIDANYDYALLFNNDASGRPDFLAQLVEALDTDPQAAAAGPTIVYAQPPDKIWYAGGVVSLRTGSGHHLGVGQKLGDLPRTDPQAVSYMTGCSMLLRVAAVKQVGLLEDRYFVYWEDLDWSTRACRAGYRLLYVPQAVVTHQVSNALGVSSPTYLYYIFRNNLLFVRLQVPRRWHWLAWLVIAKKAAEEFAKLLLRYRRDYRQYFTMIWRAFADNARRRYGQLAG